MFLRHIFLLLKPANVFIFLLFIGIISCKKGHQGDCIKRTGKIVHVTRKVESFSGIKLYHKINYELIHDSLNSIEIEAGENIEPYITTEVSNGYLTIENTIKCKFARSYKQVITCKIHYTNELSYLSFDGSGTLTCLDTLHSENILVECADASNSAYLLLDVGTLDFRQYAGSADFTMEGKCALLYLFAAGQGAMHCEKLPTVFVYATANNVSKCYVNATYTLGAEAFNYAQIYYTGNPSSVTKKTRHQGIIKSLD